MKQSFAKVACRKEVEKVGREEAVSPLSRWIFPEAPERLAGSGGTTKFISAAAAFRALTALLTQPELDRQLVLELWEDVGTALDGKECEDMKHASFATGFSNFKGLVVV